MLQLLLLQTGKRPNGFFWVLTTSSSLSQPHPMLVFVTYCKASGQEQQGLTSDSSTLEN